MSKDLYLFLVDVFSFLDDLLDEEDPDEELCHIMERLDGFLGRHELKSVEDLVGDEE